MNQGSFTPQRCLTLTFEESVATLTLHHGSMNTIDDALLDRLATALDAAVAQSAVSVLRIRSEHRVFSAGADLRLVDGRLAMGSGADEMKATVQRFHRVYNRLAVFPVVTIAEIEGTHSEEGSNSRWRAISGSPRMVPSSDCPRPRSACCRVLEARSGSRSFAAKGLPRGSS
jgi:hypothetical protein